MQDGSSLGPPEISAKAQPHKRAGVAFGYRFFLLLLLGLAWLPAGLAQPRFLLGVLLWDLLVLAAWAVDLALLPSPPQIEVRRRWRSPVALSAKNEIDIAVWNRGRTEISAEVTDDLPPELRNMPATLRISIAPGAEAAATYSFIPSQRGIVEAGDTYIRYQSVLHVAERWAVAPLKQTVHIYPNIEEAKQHSIYLVRSRQIELEKRYTRLRGRGREFESLREYRPGDEFRDMCWTATARRAKLVTRTYQVERSQPVWLVLDTGRLMRGRVSGLSKLDYAVNAALSVAQVAMFSGDRVGLLAYGRTPKRRVPVGHGSAHMRQILEHLCVIEEEAAEADHVKAAATLLAIQQRRSLVVWVTDLAETAVTPDVIEAASRLTTRHLVLFVVIGQPDLNQVAQRKPQTAAEMFRSTAAQEVAQRREVLLAGLRMRGALALEADTKSLSPRLVNQYLEIKERNQL